MTLTFKCQPGKGVDLLGALSVALVETRAFNGCVSVQTFVDSDDPDTITLIEQWESRADQEKYLTWRLESGMMEMLEPIVSAPPEFHFLDAHPE